MAAGALSPGTRIGPYPYEIVTAIGDDRGNMSQVYLAKVPAALEGQDPSLVVLKVARADEEYSAFIEQAVNNEVERLRKLKHPGIVRIFPIQRTGGIPNLAYSAKAVALPGQPLFIVLEHLSGGSVSDLIEAGPLDIGMALEIGRSIAATLDYLHGKGQVHLDLKPDNILFRKPAAIGAQVEPVLIDFGIARDINQAGLEARTAQYAPPERMRQGKAPELALPQPSMDVYALGVILYEMLTGQLPFKARSRSSLTSEIVQGNIAAPSRLRREVNRELDSFVAQLMSQDPAQRPSAETAAVQMEKIAIQGSYLPRYPSPDNVGEMLKRSRKSGGSGGGLVDTLIAVAALLLIFFTLGTYPYWRGQITFSLEGWATLLSNVPEVVSQSLIPGLIAGAAGIVQWAGYWIGLLWQQVAGG